MDEAAVGFGKERAAFIATRDRMQDLASAFEQHQGTLGFGLGDACAGTARALREAVGRNPAPDNYRVAVIGRFKVGKSYFVNELLGQRLAGVNVNPETAAITTFRSGPATRASVRIIDRSQWEELKRVWQDDPIAPEAFRVSNWQSFDGKESDDGKPFDLSAIEREHFALPDRRVSIVAPVPSGPETEQRSIGDFSRSVKRYTTSTRPLHCLVESIDIETPSPILAEGVTLIDTPGLDDTERFRVELTKRAVEEVDAVLFLTKSGASYGQGEKEFLLTLLRRGTVKQVMIVVTQVDETIRKAADDAESDGMDVPSAGEIIEREKRRLRAELEATLDAVSGEAGEAVGMRYREQIESLDIAFVSARNHRQNVDGKRVSEPLYPSDPGGMDRVRQTLFRLLSTESRLSQVKRDFNTQATAALLKLRDLIEARRETVERAPEREEAEQKLATFRSGVEAARARFATVAASDAMSFGNRIEARRELQTGVAETVALHANDVLGDYEKDDTGRHWRTRRNGGWGHMWEIQTRIANRIFPRVQTELDRETELFREFLETFAGRITLLASEAQQTLDRLALGDSVSLDVRTSLANFLDEETETLQSMIEDENQRIVALLERFMTDEVEDRIVEARSKVSAVWGKGTTVSQNAEVRTFYSEVGRILRAAVQAHVGRRLEAYGRHLTQVAADLPRRSGETLDGELDRVAADIRAAAQTAIAGERERFFAAVDRLRGEIAEGLAAAEGPSDGGAPTLPIALTPELAGPAAPVIEDETVDAIVRGATRLIARHRLIDGEKGWSFERILGDVAAGASEAWIVDPYLFKAFQRRNLQEFVLALIGRVKLKTLHVITARGEREDASETQRFYDQLDQDVYDRSGFHLELETRTGLHDRYIVFDNGGLVRLGRGLDIFKPAPGLAARQPSLRRVRGCDVELFAPDAAADTV